MWRFLVLYMVTYHSVAFKHIEIIEKWRVWVCSRSHIVHAVNQTTPESAELTDTAKSDSSPSEKCVTEQALGKKNTGTYMCLQANGLVRAAQPTSGRGIVQNPC